LKHINTLCGQTAKIVIVKARDAYNEHCAFKQATIASYTIPISLQKTGNNRFLPDTDFPVKRRQQSLLTQYGFPCTKQATITSYPIPIYL
jgi:hypothetical protein